MAEDNIDINAYLEKTFWWLHLLHSRKVLNSKYLGFTKNKIIYSVTAAVAAAAKALQSCPTLCDPIDGSPVGSSVPGILQARILEWVAIAFSVYIHIY